MGGGKSCILLAARMSPWTATRPGGHHKPEKQLGSRLAFWRLPVGLNRSRNDDVEALAKGSKVGGVERQDGRCSRLFGACAYDRVIRATAR